MSVLILTWFMARGGQGHGHCPKLTNQDNKSPYITLTTSLEKKFYFLKIRLPPAAVKLAEHRNE